MQQKIQPRRSWARRHPIIITIIAIPILAAVLFFGTAVVIGIVRGVQVMNANTPQELATAETLHGRDITIKGQMNDNVIIQEVIDPGSTNADSRQEVQEDCLVLQRIFWQHYPGMKELSVLVYGPNMNKSANTPYGGCLVKQTHAAQPWDQMNAQSAWDLYDEVYIAPIIAG